MQPNKTKLAITLTTLLTITLMALPATAITTNSNPDKTHTFVGLIVFYNIDTNGNKIPVSVSSGVLLSPTTLLTTAHGCVTDNAIVSFDQGPITWSMQGNQLQIQGVTSTYEGTAYPNPDFQLSNGGLPTTVHNDLAIIILKDPVPSSVVNTYAQLPSAGLVDTLPGKTAVTLVGYGFENDAGPIMRNYAYSKTVSGNFAWSNEFIRCSANQGNGRGGICNGDSGGPVLLGDTNIVIAINSYTVNANCAGISYHTRVDSPQILNWITEVNQFD